MPKTSSSRHRFRRSRLSTPEVSHAGQAVRLINQSSSRLKFDLRGNAGVRDYGLAVESVAIREGRIRPILAHESLLISTYIGSLFSTQRRRSVENALPVLKHY